MARLPLDRPIPTPLLPLLLRHHSVEASAAAVVEEISNFEAAVVAEEIWTIVTCSEETVRLLYRAGRRETRGTLVVSPAKHVTRANLARQREGMRGGSKDETKNADQNGPTESAMLTARGETHPSLDSKIELRTTLLRAVPHIRHQHRM
jgi:hypothetical protein